MADDFISKIMGDAAAAATAGKAPEEAGVTPPTEPASATPTKPAPASAVIPGLSDDPEPTPTKGEAPAPPAAEEVEINWDADDAAEANIKSQKPAEAFRALKRKGREFRERATTLESENRNLQKQIEELKLTASDTSKLQELQKQLDETKGVLRFHQLERSPEFQEKFDKPIAAKVNSLKRLLPDELKSAADLLVTDPARALKMIGEADDLSQLAQLQAVNAADAITTLLDARSAELENLKNQGEEWQSAQARKAEADRLRLQGELTQQVDHFLLRMEADPAGKALLFDAAGQPSGLRGELRESILRTLNADELTVADQSRLAFRDATYDRWVQTALHYRELYQQERRVNAGANGANPRVAGSGGQGGSAQGADSERDFVKAAARSVYESFANR